MRKEDGLVSKFADIQVINSLFRTGMNANADMLAELVSSLDAYKCIKQYQASDLLIALLTLESYCYLGLSKKEYLEKAISTYDSFSESVRLNDIVRFYYALSVELYLFCSCLSYATQSSRRPESGSAGR